jgi:3D (Asp-Asp-Asp) domain-containing protein
VPAPTPLPALPSRRRSGRLRLAGVIGVTALVALPLTSAPATAAGAAGDVLVLGTAADLGAAPGRPVTGLARTGTGKGYWLAASDGGVYAHGDALFSGAATGLTRSIVDIAGMASGKGYLLASKEGGAYAFGDFAFAGSMGGVRLNAPIVAAAATPTGKGYWLAARDGGVFAFGDAWFLGSAGGLALNAPIVAIDATPSGKGYRLLARDGGIFSFGDAPYAGSAAGRAGPPFVDLTTTADGKGYWVAGAEGNVHAFGSASAAASGLGLAAAPGAPVTAVAATPAGDGIWLATGGQPLGDFGVTCYALQGITASGVPVSDDVVAVDPRTVPLGSDVYVAGIGSRVALDTGPNITGRRLDVWHRSSDYCRAFGLQQLPAYAVS